MVAFHFGFKLSDVNTDRTVELRGIPKVHLFSIGVYEKVLSYNP